MSYQDDLKRRLLQERLTEQEQAVAKQAGYAEWFLTEATKDVPWQKDIVLAKHRRKALFGERRGSKTTVMGIAAIYRALLKPYSQILYIGYVQESVKRAMYDQVLARLLRTHNLPAKLLGDNEMRFDNGSILYLIGVEANKKQKENIRGVKSSLNLIDEMQNYTQDIREIIYDIVGPAAADTKADTIIGGTAGDATAKNFWYEITRDNTREQPIGPSLMHPEWNVYRFQWDKNTSIDEITGNRVCDNVRDELEDLKRDTPGIEDTEGFRKEWNAEWLIQEKSLIYRCTEANLLTSPLCIVPNKDPLAEPVRIPMPSVDFLASASYVLGADIGYGHPTAMTVGCYNLRFSNRLYIIESFNKTEMLLPEIAAKIKELDRFYKFIYMVGDSSNMTVFDGLRLTYGIQIEKANRQGKLSHQLELNGDLQTRTVVIMPGNDLLVQQLQTLTWNRKALENGKYEEEDQNKQPNDQADSCLYLHNFSRHLWYKSPKLRNYFPNQDEMEMNLVKQLIKKNKSKGFRDINFAQPNEKSKKAIPNFMKNGVKRFGQT